MKPIGDSEILVLGSISDDLKSDGMTFSVDTLQKVRTVEESELRLGRTNN